MRTFVLCNLSDRASGKGIAIATSEYNTLGERAGLVAFIGDMRQAELNRLSSDARFVLVANASNQGDLVTQNQLDWFDTWLANQGIPQRYITAFNGKVDIGTATRGDVARFIGKVIQD